MMFSLEGKTALVTGASGGIGPALIDELLAEGAAMTAMVHGIAGGLAHGSSGTQGDIQARLAHHLDDRAHPRALVAQAPCQRIGIFDFRQRIRAVAQLVLQPLDDRRLRLLVARLSFVTNRYQFESANNGKECRKLLVQRR